MDALLKNRCKPSHYLRNFFFTFRANSFISLAFDKTLSVISTPPKILASSCTDASSDQINILVGKEEVLSLGIPMEAELNTEDIKVVQTDTKRLPANTN